MTGNAIALTFLTLVPVTPLLRGSETWAKVQVYQGTSPVHVCRMRLETYQPPLHFAYGEMDKGAAGPFWYPAFHARQRLDLYRYDDWIPYFSPEIVKSGHLTAATFAAHQRHYDKDKYSRPFSSAVQAVLLDYDHRECACVVFYNYGLLDTVPDDASRLPEGCETWAFERINGRWCMQNNGALGWVTRLPFASRPALLEILRSGKAMYDPTQGGRIWIFSDKKKAMP